MVIGLCPWKVHVKKIECVIGSIENEDCVEICISALLCLLPHASCRPEAKIKVTGVIFSGILLEKGSYYGLGMDLRYFHLKFH